MFCNKQSSLCIKIWQLYNTDLFLVKTKLIFIINIILIHQSYDIMHQQI